MLINIEIIMACVDGGISRECFCFGGEAERDASDEAAREFV